MHGYLSLDIICSSKLSFPRASLSENCSLLGTDNVRGQISVHIFAPNGDYCLYNRDMLLSDNKSHKLCERLTKISQKLTQFSKAGKYFLFSVSTSDRSGDSYNIERFLLFLFFFLLFVCLFA